MRGLDSGFAAEAATFAASEVLLSATVTVATLARIKPSSQRRWESVDVYARLSLRRAGRGGWRNVGPCRYVTASSNLLWCGWAGHSEPVSMKPHKWGFSSTAKWPISPIYQIGEYPLASARREAGKALTEKKKTKPKSRGFCLLSAGSGEVSHFVRKEWRWIQSGANRSLVAFPCKQGNIQGNRGVWTDARGAILPTNHRNRATKGPHRAHRAETKQAIVLLVSGNSISL